MTRKKGQEPAQVFAEYTAGIAFKEGLGKRGMFEQNKINERFFVGDQWYGAHCGNDRPLVRHNVIKRIGEYKMAVVASSPLAVRYSADGVPNTLALREQISGIREQMAAQSAGSTLSAGLPRKLGTDEEINLVLSAMSDYFRVTAERLKLDSLKETALRNAYCSGTGVLYTYWDPQVKTGLYADAARQVPVRGDIACEMLDIENVYFGDPNLDDVQAQPYILLAQRRSVAELRREAKRFGRPAEEIEAIGADKERGYMAGDRSRQEPEDADKATVLTKLWKEWDEEGQTFRIKAVRVVRGATIRPEWELGIRLYPLAVFSWERRRNCAYGESEIPYLIPNQIAINRMLTASVWAVMMMGMPIMVVNGDVVTAPISNDPGQVIRVSGGPQEVLQSIRYVQPPNFAPGLDNNIASLISNTLSQAGANSAALGDLRPDNATAIIALREAATMPLQMVQNRFYAFIEDVARIWAEFWVTQYGERALRIEDESGAWYLPFNGDRYRDLLISVKVDVGASTLWSESQSIRTLDNLFDRQVIDAAQYLKRLPKGVVPELSGLLRELEVKREEAEQP